MTHAVCVTLTAARCKEMENRIFLGRLGRESTENPCMLAFLVMYGYQTPCAVVLR